MNQKDKLAQLAQAFDTAKRITVLTGAGISTASGIPDFRSRGGLYDGRLSVEAILSETYYHHQPKSFWTYFKEIFGFHALRQYEPNGGHLFLRELEPEGKEVTIVTQNVDGLHRKAGSTRVLEAHGSLNSAYCPRCGAVYGLEHLLDEEVPRCETDNFILKPDVVLFEGRVRFIEEAFAASDEADLFLALGSSLKVYPVNELPRYARRSRNAVLAIVNREATEMDSLFDIVLHGDIAHTFDQIRAWRQGDKPQ